MMDALLGRLSTKRISRTKITHNQPSTIYQDDPGPQIRLVEDLVALIVQQGEGIWGRADFAHFSRVSPAWLPPVRRILYSSIELRSVRQWKLLTSSLASNSSLSPLIRRISVIQRLDKEVENMSSQAVSKAITALFAGISHVREVVMEGSIAVASLGEALSALPRPRLLLEIDVKGPPPGSAAQLPRMADKLLVWSSATPVKYIQHLTLRGVQLQIALPPSHRGFPPNLTHLCLEGATVSNIQSLTVYPPLQCLTISGTGIDLSDAADLARNIIGNVHNTITQLSISVNKESEPLQFDLFNDIGGWRFPQCDHLKSLRTDGIFYSRQAFVNITSACPALDDWQVHDSNIPHFVKSWNAWVGGGKMPALKKMKVSGLTGGIVSLYRERVLLEEDLKVELFEVAENAEIELICEDC